MPLRNTLILRSYDSIGLWDFIKRISITLTSTASLLQSMKCVSDNNIINKFLRPLSGHTPTMQSHKKPSTLEFLRNNTLKFLIHIFSIFCFILFLFLFLFFSFSGEKSRLTAFNESGRQCSWNELMALQTWLLFLWYTGSWNLHMFSSITHSLLNCPLPFLKEP